MHKMPARSTGDWGGLAILLLLSVLTAYLVVTAIIGGGHSELVALPLVFVGIGELLWLLFFAFRVRGALRARWLRRRFPDAALFDVLVNDRLASELSYAGVLVGGGRRWIWPSGYITMVIDRECVAFYSRALRPRELCTLPISSITSVDIRTLDFPTRTVTRHFPAVCIAVSGSGQGVIVGLLPIRTQLYIIRRLTDSQLAEVMGVLASITGRALSPN
jgi:hypothetical protein